MNNRGLSLVEVLAVIAIVGLLAAILYPSMTKVLSNFKEDTINIQKSSIIEAAESYVADNVGITIFLDDNVQTEEITLKTLYDGGYIDGDFVNTITGNDYDLNKSNVKVKQENNSYEYTVELVDKE